MPAIISSQNVMPGCSGLAGMRAGATTHASSAIGRADRPDTEDLPERVLTIHLIRLRSVLTLNRLVWQCIDAHVDPHLFYESLFADTASAETMYNRRMPDAQITISSCEESVGARKADVTASTM